MPSSTVPPAAPLPAAPLTDCAAATLVVDVGAVVDNWRRLKEIGLEKNGPEKNGGGDCAAVVKADGYGLGAAVAAPALAAAGCRRFFVAVADEALALRPQLPADAELYVLGGLTGAGAERAYVDAGVRPVLNSLGEIDRWTALAARLGRKLPAAVHIDTGMNRLGLDAREAATLAAAPERAAGADVRLYVSHLACAEETANPMNAAQLARFRAALAALPAAPASLANSSGIFLGPDYRFDLLRPGAALYGINPTPGESNPMKATVLLHARVLQVRDVDSPAAVGYGAAHRVGSPTRIATIAAGYADGFFRSAGGRGVVCFNGVAAPVVGRVSMDLITVDVGGLPPDAVRPGDMAEIIGPNNPVDAVAERAQTIGYEILTALGRRYRRVYAPSAASQGDGNGQ